MSAGPVESASAREATRPAPLRRYARFGLPPRIVGVDVARALAVIGMIGAHVSTAGSFDFADPAAWSGIVHGRSSILFAVLAGVSIALMTGAAAGPDAAQLPRHRLLLVGRGAVIFAIGVVLELLLTPVAVILPIYGVLYIATLPFLAMRRRTLLLVAGGLTLLGPVLLEIVLWLTGGSGAGGGFVLFGVYPITVWLAMALVGIVIGRLEIGRTRVALGILAAGALASVIGYGSAALAAPLLASSSEPAPSASSSAWSSGSGSDSGGEPTAATAWQDYLAQLGDGPEPSELLRALLDPEPHSGSTADMLGAGGLAVGILAVCLLVAPRVRPVLVPIAALGAMPLTAYSAHVLVILAVAGPWGMPHDDLVWALTSLGLVVACTLWMMLVGQGPLERLVARAAARLADGGPGDASAPTGR